jgi:hypothetical protein
METEQSQEAPLVPPDPAPRAADPMVKLDLGQAPLSEVLSMANPQCKWCNGKGFQDYQHEGKTESRICGCAVRAMNKKLRGEAPVELIGRVVKDPEAERKLVQAKLDRLQKELDGAEAALAERIKGHDAGIAEAQARSAEASTAVGLAMAALDTVRLDYSELLEQVDELRALAEVKHAEVLRAVDARESALKASATAVTEVERTSADSARILASAEGIRHRVQRLKDRMALHRQKHADVLGGGQ